MNLLISEFLQWKKAFAVLLTHYKCPLKEGEKKKKKHQLMIYFTYQKTFSYTRLHNLKPSFTEVILEVFNTVSCFPLFNSLL